MDAISIVNDFVANTFSFEPCVVEFYGNRPGTDHQTYRQPAVKQITQAEPIAIVIGKHTVAVALDQPGGQKVAVEFFNKGYNYTGREWQRRGVTYDIYEGGDA